MEMLKNLIAMVHGTHGDKEAATWVRVQEAAAQLHTNGCSAMAHARSMAMDVVAKERQNLTVQPLFGVVAEVRRQFKVSFICGIKRPTLTRAAVRQVTAQKARQQQAEKGQSPRSGQSEAADERGGSPAPPVGSSEDAKATADGAPQVQATAVEAQPEQCEVTEARSPEETSAEPKREWVCTLGSKCLHCIREDDKGIWRKCNFGRWGKDQTKPIDEFCPSSWEPWCPRLQAQSKHTFSQRAVVGHRDSPSFAEVVPRASAERRPVARPRGPLQRPQAGCLAHMGAGARLSR